MRSQPSALVHCATLYPVHLIPDGSVPMLRGSDGIFRVFPDGAEDEPPYHNEQTEVCLKNAREPPLVCPK